MKKFYMYLAALVLIFYISGLTSLSAASNTPPPRFGGKLQNGIGDVKVYVDYPSGAGRYESLFKTAVNNWMYTGVGANKFYASYISSNNGSNIDVYNKTNSFWGANAPIAETRIFSYSGTRLYPGSTSSQNWYYGIIYINHSKVGLDSFTNAQATATFTHEIGHVFGFHENNSNPKSIMAQAWARTVSKVQKIDNDALNKIY